MSYWHQMYPKRQRSERVEVPNGEARFEALLAKDLKEGDRKFAESMDAQLKDQGKLSPKQVECLATMEQRYSPASVLKRQQWEMSYKAEHRPTALIVANYYITTNYFRDLALKIGSDENFVPTERQFEALTKNKYAKKAIKAATDPAAFPVGTLAKVRANYNLVSNRNYHDQVGLVVENHASGLYASSTLLINGERVKLEDRCLKSPTRGKKK
jgi:hypothetical protein